MQALQFCPCCATALIEREISGRTRQACPATGCNYIFWDNPLPVVAALVERDGLLVLARNHAWPQKMFGLITGFLERDELPQQAVTREVKEELDLDAYQVNFIGVYPFERKNELIIAYHVVATGEITLNEELAEFKLIKPQSLRPWNFGTGLAVSDWIKSHLPNNKPEKF